MTNRTFNHRKAIAALLILTLLWSFNWIVMKDAMKYMGPFTFAAARSVLGAFLLLFILKCMGETFMPPPPKPTIAIGILQSCGMVGLSQWALMNGGAGKIALLVYTMPFWIIILAAIFLHERLRPMQWLAITIAGFGLLLVLQPWYLAGSLASSIAALISGLMWGGSAIVIKQLYSSHPELNLISLTGWQMAIGGTILTAIALLLHEPAPQWTTTSCLALAYNVILANALGWGLWLYILHELPAGIAGLSSLAVPVCGVLFSWWLLHEVPDNVELTGIGMIMAALVMISQIKRGTQ